MSVLWLLGAYTEFSRLLALRCETKDPAAYTEGLARLGLTGGGYRAFQDLSRRLTQRVLATDTSDSAAVSASSRHLHGALEALDWMPAEFRDVLRGRTHLRRSKLRLPEFARRGGVLGTGAFREAVYGSLSLASLSRFMIADKLRYMRPARASAT